MNSQTDTLVREQETLNRGGYSLQLMQGDCLECMKQIPENSVNLVIADPPYNVHVRQTVNKRLVLQEWDKIDNYIPWTKDWLEQAVRVMKPNGVLYLWHSDMTQIAEIIHTVHADLPLRLISFCIWDKGDNWRCRSWSDRDPDGNTAPRSWFNRCEYCLHFFCTKSGNRTEWNKTGLERINDNPECYKELKDWYNSEKKRLNLTDKEIGIKYKEATGREPHMLGHYFKDKQFAIPTKKVWDTVYAPLGFCYHSGTGENYDAFRQDYEALRRSYEDLRKSYEEMREGYESLRHYHRCDRMHCNIWQCPQVPAANRLHIAQKPVSLLRRMIRVSCPPGGAVLDPFMGSGSTGVACLDEGAQFIGIEKDPDIFATAKHRIEQSQEQMKLSDT